MPIPELRLTKFKNLFNRYIDEFLNAEIGEEHRQLALQAAEDARVHYARVGRKVQQGEEYTDDLLRTFLPHGASTYVAETDAWRHFAPSLMGQVQKKFEASGWTKEEDWPKVAASIFELVRTGVEEPERFADACREFSEEPWTKGLQAAYLSPILNALRPDLYSVVNKKPLSVSAWLTGVSMTNRNQIARYPEVNRDLRECVDQLAPIIDPHTGNGLNRHQVFDFFSHWLVSIENFFAPTTSAITTSTMNLQTIIPDNSTRQTLLPLFAEAIMFGASLNNRNWHLSVRKKYEGVARFSDPEVTGNDAKVSALRIRLVTGSYLTASFHGDGFIAWVPRESLTEEMIARVREEGGLLQELDFRSIPETPVALCITPALASWYRETIQPLHYAYIERVSSVSKKSAWRDVHQREVVNAINAETGLSVPQPDYVFDATNEDDRKFWWLNCNPSHWDLSSLAVGDEHFYTAYNEEGNKRTVYRHMQALRVGDLVLGYETSPRKRVSAVLEITKPLTPVGNNEEFHFRKIVEVPDPVGLQTLKEHPELAAADPLASNQGSLFALTPQEFLVISELAGIEVEVMESNGGAVDRREEIRRLVQKVEEDSEAQSNFVDRLAAEEEARKILEERLGSMTEEDIRRFLDRLCLSRVGKDGTEYGTRFGIALMGHSANQIVSDPEAFNTWVGLLWRSSPGEAIGHLEQMVKGKIVKGGGISLASSVLYLRDPERFGIGLGLMTNNLREFGYDAPTKLRSADEYRRYLKGLHAFREDFDVDPRHLDYVIWWIGEQIGKTKDPPVPEPPVSLEAIAEETNINVDTLQAWVDAIERKGQAILYGPPGTGKTFVAEKLAKYLAGPADGFVRTVQFHPAYSYEDFIDGIRPVTNEETGELRYESRAGEMVRFCEQAAMKGEEARCVLIIDEINRADLARVFGELMYLLEYRDKELRLAGGRLFSIPENVRIIGTMNTADRSIALVDHALRRRFAFLELKPDYELLIRFHEKKESAFDPRPIVGLLRRVNEAIGDPHYAIGISYFLNKQIGSFLQQIWQTEIEPYLVEHFFDRPKIMEEFRWENVRDEIVREEA